MKKHFPKIFLTSLLILQGCSNVSQSDYDALASVNESLQAEYNTILNEKDSLQTAYDKLQSEYNSAKKNNDSLQAEYNNLKKSNEKLQSEYDKLKEENMPETTSISETTTTEKTTTEKSTSTDLFETVYFPYASRKKPFSFDSVKTFAESTSYDLEITEPTSDISGKIKLTDENDNYVYFSFNLVNNIETIMTVSYYDSSKNTEVSLNNYSSDGSSQYDKFKIHVIGGQSKDVKNSKEQREFLFQ